MPGKFEITEATLRICIEALEYKAHNESGQTQSPNLCGPEDYEEWDEAQRLRKRLVRYEAKVAKQTKAQKIVYGPEN